MEKTDEVNEAAGGQALFTFFLNGPQEMNPGGNFNYLDLILAIVIFAFGYKGYRKKFFKEFVGFLSLMVSMSLALRGLGLLAPYLIRLLNVNAGGSAVTGFALVFLGLMLLFHYVEKVIYKYATLTLHENLDNFLGISVGTIKGVIYASLLSMSLALVPKSPYLAELVQGSVFEAGLSKAAPAIFDSMRRFIRGSKPFIVYMEEPLRQISIPRIDGAYLKLLENLGSKNTEQWKPKAKK